MELQKKKRSENWSTEEKDMLRELISQSRNIIEEKSTKASSNIRKAQEWKNIAKRMNEFMGKNRSDTEIKLAWKRMKLSAKANLSAHRQHQMGTGGGEKLKSPTQEDLLIMDIAPHDFVVEYNNYDSDAINPVVVVNPPDTVDSENTAGPSTDISTINIPPEINYEIQVCGQDQGTSNIATKKKGNIHRRNASKNRKETMQETIAKSNTEFKKKQLDMLEVEHQYNVQIAELKIKKLKLEIEILEKKGTMLSKY